jgi:hypothetical protein
MGTTNDKTMEKPGDVIIDDITLKSYNGFEMSLKGLFQNFILYEDIFSNYMTGSITIVDSMNLVKNFPIIGAETLRISYFTPNYLDGAEDHKPVTLNFRTFKVSKYIETAQESALMVTIEFMSEQGIKSMQTKVSKAYTNMSVADMIRSIYEEYLASDNTDYSDVYSAITSGAATGILSPVPGGTILGAATAGLYAYRNREEKIPLRTFTPTFDLRSYVIPYWSPLYAINWLCHRARSETDTRKCDFVFYENSEGFHFTSLSDLKEMGKLPNRYHHYTNYPEGFRNKESERMLATEMRNVIFAKIQDFSDKAKQQALGMLASSIYTHDLTTKKWTLDTFSYDDQFDSNMALNKNPIMPRGKNNYSTAPYAHMKMYPNSSFTTKTGITVHDPNETVLKRQSLLNQMNSMNMVVEVWGDTTVKVGSVVKYTPVVKEFNKKIDKWEDDYLKGFYLITAIRHVITDREHKMTMTLSRDSFAEPLADQKKAQLQLGEQ